MQRLVVPLMLTVSGALMAFAWLGHLRIRRYGFWIALALSWGIVLPEYLLNVGATRWGYGTYTGAQMASMHLCSGVVFAAVVSHFVLGEALSGGQIAGFVLLAAGMALVLNR